MNDRSTCLASLHLRNEFTRLGAGNNKDADKLIDDLDLTTGENLQQRQILASLDQASGDGLHETFNVANGVFFLGIPRKRENVFQVIRNGVHLRERLDEVRLRLHGVEENSREFNRAFRRERIRNEADLGIFHIRGLFGLASSDLTRT